MQWHSAHVEPDLFPQLILSNKAGCLDAEMLGTEFILCSAGNKAEKKACTQHRCRVLDPFSLAGCAGSYLPSHSGGQGRRNGQEVKASLG